MFKRVLGKTGIEASVIGFGGIIVKDETPEDAASFVAEAIREWDINYFDVAPTYGNGDAEKKMGVGLQGVERDKIFLSCKTKRRDRQGAWEELERSLTRLKTDRFDLYQLHCLKHPDEVAEALGKGGAMEAIVEAQKEGKVKHIGFSAHTTKAAMAALNGFPFDTVMFPINFVEYYTIGFGKPVLKLAQEKGAAAISIKPVSRGRWPEGMERTRRWWYRPVEDPEEVGLAMRFTLGLPGVVTGIPISFLDILDRVIEASRVDRPNTEAEAQRVREIAATCESVFRREEQQVAYDGRPTGPVYPDSPHECMQSLAATHERRPCGRA